MPISSVKPYEQNPRKIPPKAVEQCAASISKFGWQQPLVVDGDMVLLAGHTWLKAALSMGLTKVPVVVVLPQLGYGPSDLPGAWLIGHALGSDGKADRRHVRRKTQKSVRDRVRQLERDRDAGKVSKKRRRQPTVREMLDRHLDVTLPLAAAPKTIYSYRSICERQIFPLWGSHRIDQLRDEHIEDGIAQLLADGLAASTVRKVLAILSSAYELQVERGNVARNPCNTVHLPQLGPSSQTALTEAESLAVFRAAIGRENASRWSVGLACGLRQGEALGLDLAILAAAETGGRPAIRSVMATLASVT